VSEIQYLKRGLTTFSFWDWHEARRVGLKHLKLPPGETVHSAFFVNELHEQIVVLVQISG
jgi:hypothetical protein